MAIEFPVQVRQINNGIQKIFKFENNYGASVVQHEFSYGREEDLWELAVIKFSTTTAAVIKNDWEITYATPITNDVIGYLTLKEVEEILNQIKHLT